MVYRESERVELKEIVVDDIKKEIIAFANCDGGRIYIGVGDDGTVLGVEQPDQVALQISNMVRDAIKPDITMFLHYDTMEEAGKNIVVVNVQRGTDRPYYISKKGMRPEGVYVRQGYSSVPASDAAIRRMIKETDGDRYEAMRSLNQNLTFQAAELEFVRRNVEFGPQQMRTLRLIDSDNHYTNLALLLSDQCMHTVRVAVFQGTDQTVFKDRREFSGSLMQQMQDIYQFIDFRNQTKATFDGLLRIDIRDYPEVAIREALLNLLVHRDYGFSASAFVSLYEDRIEFTSIGGLVAGIELEDIMLGISVCRNQSLADVFYRLQLIEAYGTGMGKIMNAYGGQVAQPRIESTRNAFKIILPNINMGQTHRDSFLSEPAVAYSSKPKKAHVSVTEEEEAVLVFASQQKSITKREVAELLGVSDATASRVLRRMVQGNLLKQQGRARNTRYCMIT